MINTFAQHRVAANLLMIMMILAGFWAVRSMPAMLDPPAHFPMVFVEVTWIGAAAEDIESLVTTPIEQQLRTLEDLQELRSRTVNGYTFIDARFNYDADIQLALDRVKQRVDNIRNLPAAIEPPVVRRPIDSEPVSILQVSSAGELRELIPLVRGFERDLLERGIETIEYSGLPAEEIALLVSGERLQALGMTLNEIGDEVARISQNVPAGSVGRGHGARQLRSLDQSRDVAGFEQLKLTSGGQVIRLGDVADVERRPIQGQPFLYSNNQPVIQMELRRHTSADAALADRIVKEWLADVRPTLPAGVEVEEIVTVWRLIEAQLSMLLKNAWSGMILVVGVLFLFLSGRVGFWVTAGIPVSFLLALAIFYSGFGYGISLVALIGFIMALGIVVDDAIVVGEDIVTHHQQGLSPAEAAVRGARRMWVPVATSSLTTMAAFLPLLIMGGEMGDVVLALPAALLCVIIASLIECFWVLPGHLRMSLEHGGDAALPAWRQRFNRGFERFRDERFMPLVQRALNAPGTTLTASLCGMVMALSLLFSGHVGFNFVTGFDFESLETNIEFASTASEQDKDAFIEHVEDALRQTHEEFGADNILGSTVTLNRAEFDTEFLGGEQYASIDAQYAFEEDRSTDPANFVSRWRERVIQPPHVEKLTIGVAGGANNGNADLTMILRGKDIDSLKQGAETLSTLLASYPGVSNVTDNLPYGKEQVIFEMSSRGRALGLTAQQIGGQLRAAYAGARVQIFNEQDSELEVRVMLPDVERDSLAALERFPIRSDAGFVPLGTVAELYSRRGIDVIRHNNTQLAASVSADVDPELNNAIAVVGDIENNHLQAILDRHELTFGLGGQSAQDQLMLETMALGGLLTLALIYLILAWVFSSYIWPLAIMLAIPFGITGALIGHFVTGWDVGAMSMLAFFSLTGIVVNDSIVLVSFLRRHVDTGEDLVAGLLQATRARFRAVILTSLTTIAGLLPLIFENSTMAMYFAPIGVTVCFGLAFSTLLVLIVIPAMILLLERGKLRVNAWRSKLLGPSQDRNPQSIRSPQTVSEPT
ncbi:MAG: efflux RND transporter permease subunit [Pseudomonadota bacterium]